MLAVVAMALINNKSETEWSALLSGESAREEDSPSSSVDEEQGSSSSNSLACSTPPPLLAFHREEECAALVGALHQHFSVDANSTSIEDTCQSLEKDIRVSQKRSHADADGAGDAGGSKKQLLCAGHKKTQTQTQTQIVAAKVRRERISERLKILQQLVPNGTKVDMVTMLEKAISYVKFLQLQVKVLATDEFWPTQGGKAPNLSQVKDAIDAILCSQRNNSSKDN